MPAACSARDHRLELLHLLAAVAEARVAVVRREEADRVVAPVVAQAPLEQRAVVDELVHRHQLDGGHAERLRWSMTAGCAERRVGAAQLLRDVRVALRQPLDVGLVDDRVGIAGCAAAGRRAQSKNGLTTTALGMYGARVEVVAAARVGPAVAEDGLVPLELAVDRLRVRVEQQLVRVAAQAAARVVRAVDAVAVALPGPDAGQRSRARRRRRPRSAARGSPCPSLLEQAELDASATLENSAKLVPPPS